jgi:hypothetical protein
MDIKPIETHYNGYRFRSRLEARWAVFFDALGIKYEYEREGYEIIDRGGWEDSAPFYDPKRSRDKKWWYLPDFYLPKTKTWVEVKGSFADVDLEYYEMLIQAVDWEDGLPDTFRSDYTDRGLLLLSNIPDRGQWCYPCIQNTKGVVLSGMVFAENRGPEYDGFKEWDYCLVDGYDAPYYDIAAKRLKELLMKWYPMHRPHPDGHSLDEAYKRARSARFEHGCSGGV